MNDFICTGVGVAFKAAANSVISMRVNATVATSESFSVHASVVSDIVESLKYARDRDFAFASFRKFVLHNQKRRKTY